MTPRLSVVIPALNEAATLPRLLDALNAQTRPPDEVIVADAGSQDGTVDLARERGARVVPGGRPGPGRNAGARTATGDMLLFLDADVLPGPDFVAGALLELAEQNYDIATCLIDPLEDELSNRILTEATNVFLQIVQDISPHAPGFCILARRSVHEAIGGFDESVKLAEDHDYVQRASKHGQFGVLTTIRIAVSMRRIEKEGLTRLALKYLWCEMYALAGKPIYSTPFEYAFGAHGAAAETTRRLIDIGRLREQLDRFENPIQRLSDRSLSRLDGLLKLDWVEGARERFWLALDRADLEILNRYLLRRLEVIGQSGRPLRASLARLQDLPVLETIRLVDLNWLRSRFPIPSLWPKDRPESDRGDHPNHTG